MQTKPINVKRYKDYIGKHYGHLTIVNIFDPGLNVIPHVAMAECLCDCGNHVVYRLSKVTSASITTCKNCPSPYEKYVGQKFKHLTLLQILPNRDDNGCILCKCKCDCGREVTYRATVVIQGKLPTCGCNIDRKKLTENESKMCWRCPYTFPGCIWSDVKKRCCKECPTPCPNKCLNTPEKCGAVRISKSTQEDY